MEKEMSGTWKSSNHTIRDFIDWDEENKLVIQPDFQRKAVWNKNSKIMLIDTIIRDYPIPKIFIQNASETEGRTVRKIIDGQQRITSILEFIKDIFKLDAPYEGSYKGYSFSQLPDDVKEHIYRYNIDCNEAYGYSDKEYRDIYSRLNKYSMPLNNQELRKADYPGEFYNLSEEIANSEILEEWRIFNAASRRRLLDVEFMSEILAALIDGHQNKKDNLDIFYERYSGSDLSDLRAKINKIIEELNLIFPNNSISQTRFKQKADFYSLVLAIDYFVKQNLSIANKDLLPLREDFNTLDENISPSEDNSIFQQYAVRCLSSANTQASRKWRTDFLIIILAGTYYDNSNFLELLNEYQNDAELFKFIEFYNIKDPLYHDSLGLCPLGDGICNVCENEISFDNEDWILVWMKGQPLQSSNLNPCHRNCFNDTKHIIYEPIYKFANREIDINTQVGSNSDFIDDLFSGLEK